MEMREIEHALIGAIIQSPSIIVEISDIITFDNFTDKRAMSAYSTILDMWRNENAVDLTTVAAREGELVVYLAESGGVGYVSNAKQYAVDIAENAKKIRLRRKLANVNCDLNSDAITSEILNIYNSELSAGGKDSAIAKVMERFDTHVAENKDRGHLGLETGFDFLSGKLIQYVPGQIWAMGGFTSTGKTAMMVEMVKRVYRHNKNPHVAIVSTEMTEEQMVARIIGNMTGIYSQRILVGDIHRDEEEIYSKALSYVAALNLHIYDDVFKVTEIENVARKHNMRDGIELMYVDYVQNCIVDGEKGYASQSEMATRFQALAKATRCCMVCLSQVSNSVGRGDAEQYELKGAGEWAAVADVGIMLKKKKEYKNLIMADVAKNRHGAKPEQVFEYNSNFTMLNETHEYQ